MCLYKISVDDKLVEQVKPAFRDEKAINDWLQSQVEVLFIQFATSIAHKEKPKTKLSERLRGIGIAPKDFNYKEELRNRVE